MKLNQTFRKLLPSARDGIAVALFGYFVLIFGLIQALTYFKGINPPENSQAASVPADSGLGVIQIAEVIVTLLVIVSLNKFSSRWFRNLASIILVLILVLEAGMAIGYSGL